jgi:molybdate transport system substrate-binding protein
MQPAPSGLVADRRGAVIRVAVVAVALMVSASCGSGSGALGVSAAASLTDVVDALESASGIDVDANLAGSSTLAEQLLDGFDADVFLTADATTMDRVAAAGLLADEPRVFASNRLVLVTPVGNPGGVTNLDDAADPALLVGVCAAAVPCGRLAAGEFAAAGVDPAVDTEEPDVRALLAKVTAGELDLALVYATDAVAAGAGVEVIAESRLHLESTYEVGVLAAGDVTKARSFVAFLVGSSGRLILAAAGFGPP